MNLFCHPSSFGVKALIEHHFWKYELSMENFNLYSTFFNGTHVIMTSSITDTTICIYSSINDYKLQSHQNIFLITSHTLGNNIYSFTAHILNHDITENDEDTIYERYDSLTINCAPKHDMYFNSIIVNNYDWNVLQHGSDFKLMKLDPNMYNVAGYIVGKTPFKQLLCNINLSQNRCNHMGKRMKNITGGYKNILFDIITEKSFSCPCSFFKYIQELSSHFKFNYVLLSYKLTQFYLNF